MFELLSGILDRATGGGRELGVLPQVAKSPEFSDLEELAGACC